MLHKTQAVVLSITKYNDRFSIVHLFTRNFGRVAYLLPRSSGRKSKLNHILFTPLSLLEVEVEHQPNRDIQRIKEARRLTLLYDMGVDMTKISIVFFLSEFLSKVMRETDNSILVYEYIKNSIEVLEAKRVGLANFHLTFMLGLTRFIGIYPNLDDYEDGCFFDLLNGEFTYIAPTHQHFLRGNECDYLNTLSRINYSNMHLFKMSRHNRNLIVDRLITYYRVHVYEFPNLKSLDILAELF